MSKNVPCRKAFTARITELARKNPDIIVVTSDARGSVTLDQYAEELPDQFVEVGIAEQNEIGIAAGMATFGKQVFVCAPACFLSARSLEQIKVDVAYTGTNVKIVGISGGISYGALGYSHHSLHDIAVMRTFPEFAVILPSDQHQTVAITDWMSTNSKTAYIRMGRGAVPDVYEGSEGSFQFGKANTLRQGTDLTMIATGEMVKKAVDAADQLASEGVLARVLDMHTIKPIDREAILSAARETGAIITVEEHSIFGGLGGAVAEIVVQEEPVPMRILGIPDEFTVVGESADVFAYYGLTPAGLAKEARAIQKRK
ncbi:transketolase C-terminal domain-containing protein [Marispirochaeta aestuarii]|uniref:transketolase family protein n=1 Tax=Marispirochaeta aestuarii TaxID=1963862 RepID=UPI0029C7D861|nr:transketolase C-terminal domain-containing protein [Marispirochaeta aestuarii]